MSLVFENVVGLDDESTRFDGDEETDCRSDLAGSCVDAEHDEYDPTIDDAYVASLSMLQKILQDMPTRWAVGQKCFAVPHINCHMQTSRLSASPPRLSLQVAQT